MAKFVELDESLIDKHPPDLVMESDAICSMDQARLAKLPRSAAGAAVSQATTRASTRSAQKATTAAAERCATTTSKRNPNSSSNNSSSIITGGGGGEAGQHGKQQQHHLTSEEERSERACTGESLLGNDERDDFLENLRELEWEAGTGGAAVDPGGGHDVDGDDEHGGGEGRSGGGGGEVGRMKKRKNDVGKGVGEDASDADKQRAR